MKGETYDFVFGSVGEVAGVGFFAGVAVDGAEGKLEGGAHWGGEAEGAEEGAGEHFGWSVG